MAKRTAAATSPAPVSEPVVREPDDPAAVQRMLQEADEVTNESLEATRRIRQLALESRDTGANTLNTLQQQGGMCF